MILTTLRTQIKWVLVAFLVAFLLAIPLTYGIGNRSGNKGERTGDYSVARIDGKELRLSQLHMVAHQHIERMNIKDVASGDIAGIYQEALDGLILDEAITAELKRRGVQADPASVDARLKALETQYITKEAFIQALQQSGSSIENVKASLARELSVEKMMASVTDGVTVPEEDLKMLYDTLASAKMPGIVKPAGVEVHMSEWRSEEAAKEFAEKLKGGMAWKDATEALSGDLLGASDGVTPSVISDKEITQNYQFVGALQDGEVSGAVEIAEKDYLVVQRIKAVSEKTASFEEARPQIESLLLQQARSEAMKTFLDSLKKTVKVEILDPSLFPVAKPASADTAPASSDKTEVKLTEPASNDKAPQ